MTKYGCHNRAPFAPCYYSTNGYKPIPHVTTTDCQFTKSELGKVDPKCEGCNHKQEEPK